MNISRDYYNEFFLALYLFVFTLLRIFTTTFRSVSTLILFFTVILILFCSYLYNKGRVEKEFIIFFIFSIIFWIIQFIFFFNSYTIHYLYYFIIYGLFTMYFFSQMKNIPVFLDYYSKLALVAFFVLSIDPIMNFRYSATYMTFGTALLPAFCGLTIGWIYFKKNYYFIFTIASFIMLLFFANRSAILTSILFFLITYYYLKKPKKHEYKNKALVGMSIVVAVALFIVLLVYLNTILIFLNDRFMIPYGFESYSLNTLIRFSENWDFLAEYSSRGEIQDEALLFIKNNNLIVGNGIGSFHDYYGRFSHNYLIDIMNGMGILGVFTFIILICSSFKSFLRSSSAVGVFAILMFCLSMIPLTFSSTYIETAEFWIFLMFGLFLPKFKHDNILMNDSEHKL